MDDNEGETYQKLSSDSSEGEDDESSRSFPRNHQPTGYTDLDEIEAATMDSQIPISNIGYKMLLRMGWKEGTGLGSTGQGRTEPVRIEIKQDVLGIGKAEEEAIVHLETTRKRKALESEKIEAETDEERLKRETMVKQMEATKKEVESMNKTFYCELCDKQYTRITEFETHLSSYDHNHKKRFREMQQSAKPVTSQAERDKKREKERKREEKEMKILQEAAAKRAGVQTVTVQSTSIAPVATTAPEGSQNSTSKQGVMSFGFAKKTPAFKITMKK